MVVPWGAPMKIETDRFLHQYYTKVSCITVYSQNARSSSCLPQFKILVDKPYPRDYLCTSGERWGGWAIWRLRTLTKSLMREKTFWSIWIFRKPDNPNKGRRESMLIFRSGWFIPWIKRPEGSVFPGSRLSRSGLQRGYRKPRPNIILKPPAVGSSRSAVYVRLFDIP